MSRELPQDTIANGIAFGDYVVSDRHGHIGRAYRFEMLTSSDQDWLDGLDIPITIEEIQEPMISILCHDGGSVSVPASSCTIIPTIKGYTHRDMADVFPSVVRNCC